MFVVCLIFLALAVPNLAAPRCTTPNSENGQCIRITNCPSLYALFQNRTLETKTVDFLRLSFCGLDGKTAKVCCSIDPPVGPAECGVSTQTKIIGGNVTDIDEFPWMALLRYENTGKTRSFYCGGVLISKRYVLTAAHCLKFKNWKLVSVRLGEHDIETTPDCVSDEYGKDCAPDPEDIAIEEQIPHEQYVDDPTNINHYNDIALLRLQREVIFTDFIKPICLPKPANEISKTYVGQRLDIAGWGRTETRIESNIKLKAKIPVTDFSTCNSRYNSKNIQLGDGQMCAGGERGRDSCNGDSGGPLMTLKSNRAREVYWYVVGITSFGGIPCGQPGWPGVYTKVSKYVTWIVNKMRP